MITLLTIAAERNTAQIALKISKFKHINLLTTRRIAKGHDL